MAASGTRLDEKTASEGSNFHLNPLPEGTAPPLSAPPGPTSTAPIFMSGHSDVHPTLDCPGLPPVSPTNLIDGEPTSQTVTPLDATPPQKVSKSASDTAIEPLTTKQSDGSSTALFSPIGSTDGVLPTGSSATAYHDNKHRSSLNTGDTTHIPVSSNTTYDSHAGARYRFVKSTLPAEFAIPIADLYTNSIEADDDDLHRVDYEADGHGGQRIKPLGNHPITLHSWANTRALVNGGMALILILALLMLFAGYPILTQYRHHDSYLGG